MSIKIASIHFKMEKDFIELWESVSELDKENKELKKEVEDLTYLKEENKRLKEELKNRG